MLKTLALAVALLGALTGSASARQWFPGGVGRAAPPTGITHVLVIMQENRTVDNLYNGFAGADTVTSGLDSHGTTITLQFTPNGLATAWDPRHHLTDYYAACNGTTNGSCAMDSFDKEGCSGSCGQCQIDTKHFAYCYVNPALLNQYHQMATVDGQLNDETFQAFMGPSGPAHIGFIAASTHISPSDTREITENDIAGGYGCDNTGTTQTVDTATQSFSHAGPVEVNWNASPVGGLAGSICPTQATVLEKLVAAGYDYQWYQNAIKPSGDEALWTPLNNLTNTCLPLDVSGHCSNTLFTQHIQQSNAVGPATLLISAISLCSGNTTPGVIWYTPEGTLSDHPNLTTNGSQSTVANIVNAVGESTCTNGAPNWTNTVIVLLWDDWGGWYDHKAPPQPTFSTSDPFVYGFRVPLVIMGSSVKSPGTVDHTIGGTECLPKFIKTIFGLTGQIGPFSIEDHCTNDWSTTMLGGGPHAFVPL